MDTWRSMLVLRVNREVLKKDLYAIRQEIITKNSPPTDQFNSFFRFRVMYVAIIVARLIKLDFFSENTIVNILRNKLAFNYGVGVNSTLEN